MKDGIFKKFEEMEVPIELLRFTGITKGSSCKVRCMYGMAKQTRLRKQECRRSTVCAVRGYLQTAG